MNPWNAGDYVNEDKRKKKGELLYRKVIELIHQKLFCGSKKKRENTNKPNEKDYVSWE